MVARHQQARAVVTGEKGEGGPRWGTRHHHFARAAVKGGEAGWGRGRGPLMPPPNVLLASRVQRPWRQRLRPGGGPNKHRPLRRGTVQPQMSSTGFSLRGVPLSQRDQWSAVPAANTAPAARTALSLPTPADVALAGAGRLAGCRGGGGRLHDPPENGQPVGMMGFWVWSAAPCHTPEGVGAGPSPSNHLPWPYSVAAQPSSAWQGHR